MKPMLKTLLISITILAFSNTIGQNTITSDDLKLLLGEWKGSLTYMDYSTNNPYTMPSNIFVENGNNDKQIILNISYPKEPNANSKDKIKISKDGSELNNKAIKSREVLSNGQIQIITEYPGKDNNQKALIRNIYLIGSDEFMIRKEVKFENKESWLLRNVYKFER